MPDFRRRATREAMSLRLDFNGIMANAVGSAGVSDDEVNDVAGRAGDVAQRLQARRAAGELAFYDLPYRKDAVAAVKAVAAAVRAESDALVVLGIGGSALGAKALVAALADAPRGVHVADNIDPWSFGRLLAQLDLSRTTFNVVSKSGDTAETVAQFLIVRGMLLRHLGAVDYARRVVVTTDAESGALRQVIHDEGFRDLAVPANVAGCLSALTAVGLLPAAVAGIKVDDVLAGAAWMDRRCAGAGADVRRHPAHLLGTLLYLAATHRQQRIVVMMPYSDRLRSFAAWFAHLWAENLGRARVADGRGGQTPVTAVGATDQHALLQRFTEGAADTVIIMLRVEDHGCELPVPEAYTDLEAIGYLGGTGLGQLLNLEQQATEVALLKQQRPVITIVVPQLNAFTLGQLFYLFQAAAVFAAALHGVAQWDQPGREDGRRLTYGLAGRQGFEAARAEAESWQTRKQPQYIL